MIEKTKINCGTIVKVILPINCGGYDYFVPAEGEFFIGDLVRIPFRTGLEVGVIWEEVSTPPDYPRSKIKTISEKIEDFSLSESMRNFVQKVASYTMSPLGNVVKMVIGAKDIFKLPKRAAKESGDVGLEAMLKYAEPELSSWQKAAAGELADAPDGFSCALLDGITGSGKTEVYFKAAADMLAKDPSAQVLILLPEIALTSQFMDKFERRFGVQPFLWHSNLTPARRRETWRAAISGRARVVVGTRSALFLPFKKLALIVLDEEHDGSYKQEDQVIYHGRDMAVLRASVEKIPIILASATPSIESWANAKSGRYRHVRLLERFGNAGLPDITLIDMRKDKPGAGRWISAPLSARIARALNEGEQVMLYINRRGYAPVVLCGGCGAKLSCPNCSVNMAIHGAEGCAGNARCLCHYCGRKSPLPEACKECGKNEWVLVGPGIERIVEEAGALFPEARIAAISSDMLTSQSRLAEIIASIERREVDIIVGTQIVAKGHHFPLLTLVGVVDGDMSFAGGDLRANEDTFQILTQVSGRSGRGERSGEVAIQTYNPENPVMRAFADGNRDSFLDGELADRKAVGMPPYTKLASVLISSSNRAALAEYVAALGKTAPVAVEGIKCYGPIDAPLSVINKQHRKRFLLVADKGTGVQAVLKKWLSLAGAAPRNVKLKIDIDPYDFM